MTQQHLNPDVSHLGDTFDQSGWTSGGCLSVDTSDSGHLLPVPAPLLVPLVIASQCLRRVVHMEND